jgi:tetratricopeptide (TPR) repeat protein
MLALTALSADAQKKSKEPKRPGIAGADTNDASAYYTWGASHLNQYPDDAADAFYWSIRLNPSSADYYYARWAAMLLSDPDRLVLYDDDDAKTMRSPEIQQIDSLRLYATELNPYLYRKYERVMWQRYVEQVVLRQNPGSSQAEVADYVREYTRTGGPETRAVNAYTSGNLPMALQQWAAALPGYKDKSYIHAERGRIFYMLQSYDSATAEMTQAVAEMRKSDKKHVVYIYDSKAIYEHSLAMIAMHQGNVDAAREAYGRALEEDLSYAPAHVQLAAIALVKGDTAGALSEMAIATQVRPNDGFIAFEYGVMLAQAGKAAEALTQLQHAASLEPYYAAPRWVIALLYDGSEMNEEALAAYKEFLARASQRDPGIAKAKERIAALSTPAAPATPAPAKP